MTPPGWISSTIWSLFFGGGSLVGVGSGSWTSIAFRESGMMIMKMISSTSSTSIIGVTFGSLVSAPRWPVDIAMLLPSFDLVGHRIVALDDRSGAGHLFGDHPGHADAVVSGDVNGRHDLAVVQVLVRLEVHDLVLSAGIEELLEERRQILVVNRLLVQEVLAIDVDTQHDVRVVFRVGLEVLPTWRLGLEPCVEGGHDDHENDQQHEHDVDHWRHVRFRLHPAARHLNCHRR